MGRIKHVHCFSCLTCMVIYLKNKYKYFGIITREIIISMLTIYLFFPKFFLKQIRYIKLVQSFDRQYIVYCVFDPVFFQIFVLNLYWTGRQLDQLRLFDFFFNLNKNKLTSLLYALQCFHLTNIFICHMVLQCIYSRYIRLLYG